MTSYLFVQGDDDYGAMDFEDNVPFEKVVEIYNEMKSSNKDKIEYSFRDSNDIEVTVDLKRLEFGPVDSDFESFLFSEMLDYDTSKHKTFIRISD